MVQLLRSLATRARGSGRGRTYRRWITSPMIFALGLLVSLLVSAAAPEPLRVDLNPANGRADIRTHRGPKNWAVTGPLPVADLRRPDGHAAEPVTAGRPLVQTPARPRRDPDVRRRRRRGLTRDRHLRPGAREHSLATYHNLVTDGPPGPYDISVDGERLKSRASGRAAKVHDDTDAACAYVEFNGDRQPVVVTIKSAVIGPRGDPERLRDRPPRPEPQRSSRLPPRRRRARRRRFRPLTLAWTAPRTPPVALTRRLPRRRPRGRRRAQADRRPSSGGAARRPHTRPEA